MPETPKEKPKLEEEQREIPDDASWGEDQKERGYYYDDAHGYEVYEPDDDEKEEAD